MVWVNGKVFNKDVKEGSVKVMSGDLGASGAPYDI